MSVTVCLAFPDAYEIGMSHTGTKILYEIVNRRPDWACERTYAPWVDFEAILRREKVPLFSVESFAPVSDFDVVGFSLQSELNYTNVPNMLELSGIPVLASGPRRRGPHRHRRRPVRREPRAARGFLRRLPHRRRGGGSSRLSREGRGHGGASRAASAFSPSPPARGSTSRRSTTSSTTATASCRRPRTRPVCPRRRSASGWRSSRPTSIPKSRWCRRSTSSRTGSASRSCAAARRAAASARRATGTGPCASWTPPTSRRPRRRSSTRRAGARSGCFPCRRPTTRRSSPSSRASRPSSRRRRSRSRCRRFGPRRSRSASRTPSRR